MKKTLRFVTAVTVCFLLMAGVSFAEDTWSACTPKSIGPYGDVVRVGLDNCNVAPQKGVVADGVTYMDLSTTGTDQMMAVILTAMSLGQPVAVMTDGTTYSDGYGVISAVLLSK